jgi:hypothetical protein
VPTPPERCPTRGASQPLADFADPPLRENAAGRPRTVGVEVEFGAIGARRAAAALAAGLGGAVAEEDAHALAVRGTALGDVMVEIDMRRAHPQRHRGTRWGRLGAAWAARLGTAAQCVVPRELVTGPLPIDRLALVDRAVGVLRRAGAREAGPVAFGLHFNPEPPRLDAETIAAILKAFVLLNDWLRRESRPRRLSHRLGFGRDYPPAYVRRVVAADYWPDLAGLMGDYLAGPWCTNRGLWLRRSLGLGIGQCLTPLVSGRINKAADCYGCQERREASATGSGFLATDQRGARVAMKSFAALAMFMAAAKSNLLIATNTPSPRVGAKAT